MFGSTLTFIFQVWSTLAYYIANVHAKPSREYKNKATTRVGRYLKLAKVIIYKWEEPACHYNMTVLIKCYFCARKDAWKNGRESTYGNKRKSPRPKLTLDADLRDMMYFLRGDFFRRVNEKIDFSYSLQVLDSHLIWSDDTKYVNTLTWKG